jgi:hypothetical protein
MLGREAEGIEHTGSTVFEQQYQCITWPINISVTKIIINQIWVFNLK